MDWSNVPDDLLVAIGQKISFLSDYVRFTAVCKSWGRSVSEYGMPCLPLGELPLLFLAEKVAPEALRSDCEYDSNEDYVISEDEEEDSNADSEEEEEEEDSNADSEEEEEDSDDYLEDSSVEEEENNDDTKEDERLKILREECAKYNPSYNSVGTSRALWNLVTKKTYNIELPEAAGRLICGLNNGWLVTLGRDLQINLLHPLLRRQISLPPMLTFSRLSDYHENYFPEDDTDIFIKKVAASSNIVNKNAAVSVHGRHASPSPIVMATYGMCSYLAYTRLGDNVWTDVNVPSKNFDDLIFHKGNFYAIDVYGNIFLCDTNGDDKESGKLGGTRIASLITNTCDKKYLVESSSGLLLLVRYRKVKYFELAQRKWHKYRTTDFSIGRLDIKNSDSLEDISCNLTEVSDLGNETIFVGKSSSISLSSTSNMIKPNCIYFTDDYCEMYTFKSGGHDMGIFSMKDRTIEPHFVGKSLHPISPPMWYI